jgi:hypothetical protein
MIDWKKVLIAGFVGGLLLGLVVEHSVAEEVTVDVSQVNGLPQKLQALQDQINAILATLPKTYATAAALASLKQQLQAIQLTPGPKGDPGPPGPAGMNCLADPNCKAYVDAADAALNLKILDTATTLTARLTDQTVVVVDANGQVVGPIIGWSADKAEPIVSVTAPNGWVFNAIATVNGLSTVGLPFVTTYHLDLLDPSTQRVAEAQVFFDGRDCTGQAYIQAYKKFVASDGSIVDDVTPFSIGAWTPTRIYLTIPGGSPNVMSPGFRSALTPTGQCVLSIFSGLDAPSPKALYKTATAIASPAYALPFEVK